MKNKWKQEAISILLIMTALLQSDSLVHSKVIKKCTASLSDAEFLKGLDVYCNSQKAIIVILSWDR